MFLQTCRTGYAISTVADSSISQPGQSNRYAPVFSCLSGSIQKLANLQRQPCLSDRLLQQIDALIEPPLVNDCVA